MILPLPSTDNSNNSNSNSNPQLFLQQSVNNDLNTNTQIINLNNLSQSNPYHQVDHNQLHHHHHHHHSSSNNNSNNNQQSPSLRDLELVSTLGTGTFGRVCLVRVKRPSFSQPFPPSSPSPSLSSSSSTSFSSSSSLASPKSSAPGPRRSTYYALKVLEKSKVVKLKQVEHVRSEKMILDHLTRLNRDDSPFAKLYVHLVDSFQDPRNVYLLQEFVQGGELFHHLRRRKRFSRSTAKFYSANVFLALEGLHRLRIAYRDLKPENILITSNGYIKLTDFGFAKVVNDRTWTVCGTPEYLAPEIIQSQGHGQLADWWAFGVLLYEMLVGYPPFYATSENKEGNGNGGGGGSFEIYQKILNCDYKLECHRIDLWAKDLIARLLIVDKSKRLGNLRNGILDIKFHPWFEGVDWEPLLDQTIPAPIIPKIVNELDTSNFENFEQVRSSELPGLSSSSSSSNLSTSTASDSSSSFSSSSSSYSPLSTSVERSNFNVQQQSITKVVDPYQGLFDSF